MRFLKHHFPVAIIIFIALIVAGCGGTSGTTTPLTPTATTASVPTTVPTPSPTPQPTATPSPVNALIHTTQVTVNGTMETALTNAAGKTLYYLTADTPTTTACTGQCITFWLPLLATGALASSTPLPHQLSVLTDANGQQVEYDGHLLYTFSGDTAAGQTQGEGIQSFGGTWYVVAPNL
jgi:predicted lipoprotein with Yx(FWY)xxD motif